MPASVGQTTPPAATWRHPTRRAPVVLLRSAWLLYPLFLFTLPDHWQGPLPMAPESVLLVGTLYLIGLADFASKGHRLAAAVARIPGHLWALLGIIAVAWAASGQATAGDFARIGLWGMTLLYASYFGSDALNHRRFFLLWTVLGVGGAIAFLLLPDRWGAFEVHLMAFQHRTGFAYFLSVPTALLLYRIAKSGFRWHLGRVAALAVLVPALLITSSRGAWLVLIVGCLVVLAYRKGGLAAFALALPAGLGALLFVATSGSEVALRLRSIWDLSLASSSFYRLDLLFAAVKALPDVGWLGAGPDSAANVLAAHTIRWYRHLDPRALETTSFSTDSDLVWLLTEAGPIAAVLLLWALASWGRRIRYQFGVQDQEQGVRNLILLTLLSAMVLFDNILSTPFGWFLLGVGVASSSPRALARQLPS